MMLDIQGKEGGRFCRGVKHGRIQTIITTFINSFTFIYSTDIYFVPGSEGMMWVLLPSGVLMDMMGSF